MFYDIFKLELPARLVRRRQVDRVLLHARHLRLAEPRLRRQAARRPARARSSAPTNFRLPSFGADSLEPNLKPMKSQEFTAGLDHELNATMAVRRALRPQAARPRG